MSMKWACQGVVRGQRKKEGRSPMDSDDEHGLCHTFLKIRANFYIFSVTQQDGSYSIE